LIIGVAQPRLNGSDSERLSAAEALPFWQSVEECRSFQDPSFFHPLVAVNRNPRTRLRCANFNSSPMPPGSAFHEAWASVHTNGSVTLSCRPRLETPELDGPNLLEKMWLPAIRLE
jgi:hypothetical protein